MATGLIPVAETFLSIQGEGVTAGVPAVFIRTAGCNLTCPKWGGGTDPHGCDTTAVWRKVWARLSPHELVDLWRERGDLDHISAGAHLVVTGGEPLLWQEQLASLLQLVRQILGDVYVEVETNSTVRPSAVLSAHVSQFNCSPKLRSAGNGLDRAYRHDSISWFAADPRSWFKFVIQDLDDVNEVIDCYVDRYSLARDRVMLMPQSASREEYISHAKDVAELCIEHGFRYSSRLQLVLWDRATGI